MSIKQFCTRVSDYLSALSKAIQFDGHGYLVDKTKCGEGLTIFPEPLSRNLTKNSSLRATVCIAKNASLCNRTGVAFGKSYILDKNPFSYHIKYAKRIKIPTESLDAECISFVGPFMDNYCHLVLYILINAPIINESFRNHTLLLPSSLKGVASLVEAINACFPNNPKIYLDKPIFVKLLYKIEVVVDENSVKALRELIYKNFEHKFSLKPKKNIFVARNGANRRICLNQKDVLDKLTDSYYLIDCSKLSFLEQFETFYFANNIIGIHGAALINLIFCKDLKKLYEFKDPRNDDFIFRSIAENLFKAKYHVSYGYSVTSTEFRIKKLDIDNVREYI